MIAFSFKSISFRPPLPLPRLLFINVEIADGSSQSTESFSYSPSTKITPLNETLEFFVKSPLMASNFRLEISEFDEKLQIWQKIAKEVIYLAKLYESEAHDITLPTIYGTDAVVDVHIELSQEFRDILEVSPTRGDTTIASLDALEDQSEQPKKISKREKLKKMFFSEDLNLFKLAPLTNECMFAVSLIFQAKENVRDFATWKNPHKTFMISILLTLILMYGRFLLGLGLLGFLIFWKRVVSYVEMTPSKQLQVKQSKKQMYKTNLHFLKDSVNLVLYCFGKYREIFEDPEKTLIFKMLYTLKKFSPLIILALFTMKINTILLLSYWIFILYNTQNGKLIFQQIFFKTSLLLDVWDRFILPAKKLRAKISPPDSQAKGTISEVSTLSQLSLGELSATQKEKTQPIFKEKIFVIFENQRWWPGKGWRSELLPRERPSWSDDAGLVEMRKENINLPGPNWHWETDWNYVMLPNTDQEGWEYASRFKKFEDPNRKRSLIHGVRRRKWVRKCIGFED